MADQPSGSTSRRRRPEERRQAIVEATAELITEVGVDAVTHRMIASRAGVPLGSTTQYFDTLEDLRTAALAQLAGEIQQRMAALRAILDERGVTPAVLTRLIVDALDDAAAIQADRVVVTAAVHDPRVRELARLWSTALVGFLSPRYGATRARAAAAFIDGLLWSSLIDESPPDSAVIETGLTGILVAPDPASPAADVHAVDAAAAIPPTSPPNPHTPRSGD